MKHKISLAVIGKNNEKTLARLFNSVKGVFDEIVFVDTGSTDKTKKIAESYGAKVYDFEWCDDFSAARQYSFDQCTNDWIMWLDTDDVVKDADKIHLLLDKAAPNVHGIGFSYFYAFNKYGACTTVLWRERLVKRGHFEWKGRVHEVLVPKKAGEIVRNEEVQVHHIDHKHNDKEKSLRNLELLLLQYKDEKAKQEVDPRTLYYIGNTYYGMEAWEEAYRFYNQYVMVSGWEEELYQAWVRMAHICRQLGANDKAFKAATNAWHIFPHYPDSYIANAWTYQNMGEYKKSNKFLQAARYLKKPEWMTAYNPQDYSLLPLKLAGNNYVALGKLRQAIRVYQKATSMNQNDDDLHSILEELKKMKDEQDQAKGYFGTFKKIRGNERAVKELYNSIPSNLKQYPSIIQIRNSFDVKVSTTGKDIVIYCGEAWEEWSPDSVEGGIGGSEEAVINLAFELQKNGYNVVVYNTITEAKEFDGVWYKPWWEFNVKDKWDYFVSWRHESIFDKKINADKKYLWLHDVPNPNEFFKERLDNIDKIIVLSKYHRELLPDVEDDKFFVTSNGVNVDLFNQKIERKANKVIYTSSYDRGLEHLLDVWPEVKKAVPKAELEIYYGWDGFDKRFSNNPERKEWKASINAKIEALKGVYENGRVGHAQIAKKLLESSVWAYPTDFEEINCISALKAQIGGAVPVVINYAALKETVRYGVKIDGPIEEKKNEYTKELVRVLTEGVSEDERKRMMSNIKDDYSWESITKDWINNLF